MTRSCCSLLLCPVCAASLSDQGRTFVCANRHSFDVAREGYVNLLARQGLGDSKEMLLARRRFLGAGHYTPLSDAVNTLAAEHLQMQDAQAPLAILDAGCGEGYYLQRIAESFQQLAVPESCFIGLDSAREAIRLATRRDPALCWVVGDIWRRIPLVSSSCAVLLNIFAPRNIAEFARVVAPGGLALIVIPAEDHLSDLRSLITLVNIEFGKQERIIADLAGSFEPLVVRDLAYDLTLSGVEASDLVTMSPSSRHVTREDLESLQSRSEVRANVHLTILVFRRLSMPFAQRG